MGYNGLEVPTLKFVQQVRLEDLVEVKTEFSEANRKCALYDNSLAFTFGSNTSRETHLRWKKG